MATLLVCGGLSRRPCRRQRSRVYQCNKGSTKLSTVWLEMPKQRSTKRRSKAAAPRRRDPVATRKKLLTAARREFARCGLAGARVDEIAERAGVNKQLVYHYFGDKDALYLAVLEWVYEEIRAQERQLNLEGLPPQRAIQKLIESSFDHLALHPDFIVLLNDENRNGARHVRASLQDRGHAFAAGQPGLEDSEKGCGKAFSAAASTLCISIFRSRD